MLTLVTGTPGAGKTLYTVSDLIRSYAKQEVTVTDDDGVTQTRPRRIVVDGIRKLAVDHEMMTPTRYNALTEVVSCEGEGVLNWWEWCRPGDVIVVDEVQRMWRPRGNGSKVPQMIAELETHRHRGVDFVIVTQHPMLLDQNVRRLIGRHIHLRRLWGMARCARYEWDHCSSPDRIGDAGKSYWPYPKDAYKLYASAEVHTKQGGKAPAALLVLGLACVALPIVGYTAVTKTQSMLHPVAAPAQAHIASVEKAVAPAPASVKPAEAGSGAGVPVTVTDSKVNPPVVAVARPLGCIVMADRCSCFDGEGVLMAMEPAACRDGAEKLRAISVTSTPAAAPAAMSKPAALAGPTPRSVVDVPPAPHDNGHTTVGDVVRGFS